MSDTQKLFVVTKDGQKVSQPMTEAEANVKASEMRTLLESSGQQANISVVPLLLG